VRLIGQLSSGVDEIIEGGPC